MIRIDGAMGEGGGQVLRSSLTCAVVTGQPFEIHHIRANRRKGGLLRQHLTCVQAAAAICGATVEGDALRSSRVVFHPGPIRAGEHHFQIGTAGSTSLVLQTLIPALCLADGPSTIIVEGGTHNGKSPPFHFLQKSFLPLLEKMGPTAEATLLSWGFYPAGGGRIRLKVSPVDRLSPLDLTDAGPIGQITCRAVVSGVSRQLARKQRMVLQHHLGLESERVLVQSLQDPRGPGNVVWAEVARDTHTELFSAVGERSHEPERAAHEVVDQVSAYIALGAATGEHLADQLLLPMAIAGGGRFTSCKPSLHTRTNAQVIQRFIDIPIDFATEGEVTTVRVGG